MGDTFFKCNGQQMRIIQNKLSLAQGHMDDAYTAALSLQEELAKKENWTGNAELTAEAFLDLLIQYQKDFNGEDNPQALADLALTELRDNVKDFYDNFPEYKTLEGFTE